MLRLSRYFHPVIKTRASPAVDSSSKGNNGKAQRRRCFYQGIIMTLALLCSLTVAMMMLPRQFALLASSNDDDSHTGNYNYYYAKKNSKKKKKKKKDQVTIWKDLTDGADRKDEEKYWRQIVSADILPVDWELRSGAWIANRRQTSANYQPGDYWVSFCRVDWVDYRRQPSRYAMFRYLVRNSASCRDRRIRAPLDAVLRRVQEYNNNHAIKTLPLTGAIFHQSRCGSTLMANMLASLPNTRVYGEAGFLNSALSQCVPEAKPNDSDTNHNCPLFRDLIYLASRAPFESPETRVFVKFPSRLSLQIGAFRAAFPAVPWIYLYREPVAILQSYFKSVTSDDQVKCDLLSGALTSVPRAPTNMAEHCAAVLATIGRAGAEQLTNAQHTGLALNYQDLPAAAWERAWPHWTGGAALTPLEQERMEAASGEYSKGWTADRRQRPVDDADTKRKAASPAVQAAARLFLQANYDVLEGLRQGAAV